MLNFKGNIDQSLEILQQPKTKLSDLLKYLESSPLAGSYDFGLPDPPPAELMPRDIEKICKELQKHLLDDLTYDKLTALYVASSLTYLMSSSFQDFECRTELLHRTFRYTNNLDPVNLHVAAKRLHANLKSDTNLLFLCKNICFSSDMGNAISLCLMWAMFLEAFEKPIEMYCFHPFSLINELVAEVDIIDMIKRNETVEKAAFLLQLIAGLVRNIISSSHEAFEKAGYREYFKYDLESIHTLRDWANTVNQKLGVSIEKTNTNFELTLAIQETLAFSIISPLDDKLKTINGGRDHFGLEHTLC